MFNYSRQYRPFARKTKAKRTVSQVAPAPPAGFTIPIETNGLQAYLNAAEDTSYPETGDIWYDLTDNNYQFSAIESPTWEAGPPEAFVMDGHVLTGGVNDHFNIGDILDWGTGDMSIGAWVNPDAVNLSYRYIVSKSSRGNAASRWGLGIKDATPFFFCMTTNTSDGTMIWDGQTGVTAGAWSYITYVTDRANDTIKMFVNGTPMTVVGNSKTLNLSNTLGEDINSTFPYWIGASPESNYIDTRAEWTGKIAEIHHYNRALTDAEVLSNYNATSGTFA